MSAQPTVRDIWLARTRLRGIARRTLIRHAPEVGPDVWIADETTQPTGAFKIRGAANALLSLEAGQRERGVVAVSTGNHGRAVAYVARELGTRATVFLSNRVPTDKVEALRRVGADVVVGGDSQDLAEDAAREHAARTGAALIPPFDHPAVIAGQGTLGLEIVEELPTVRTVVVPLSGGGLIAGVALAVKSVDPAIRAVGVSMAAGAVMHASLRVGRVVEMPESGTLADSLQGGLGRDNAYTFGLVRDFVDDAVLVSEEAIANAMRHAFHHHRLVLEGGGAAALAALLSEVVPTEAATGTTVVIASGANVAADTFARVLGGATS
ncbi:MAG TPA: pyridoxal-phosphate dependent enzyme [Trueperaceae bacterium]|nr:pyridoxal-phosphate dependent enzyme [Trueperaceae bacterium]